MAEYIEREALMKDIEETVLFSVRSGAGLLIAEMRGSNKVIDRIKSAPSADVVEVVHGYYEKYDDSEFCYCSECGKPSATDGDVSWHGYCPVCGANMDGKEEVK